MTFYHATTGENAEKILRSGINVLESMTNFEFYGIIKVLRRVGQRWPSGLRRQFLDRG